MTRDAASYRGAAIGPAGPVLTVKYGCPSTFSICDFASAGSESQYHKSYIDNIGYFSAIVSSFVMAFYILHF
jgi:hypothetical protein